MRRLTEHLRRSAAAHRDQGERGAVAVLTALVLVVLLGFAAIAIDVGMLYQERAELQSGADAAALAVAQDCAKGLDCTGPLAHPRAQEMAERNAKDGAANAAEPVIAGNTVRVDVSTRDESGAGSLALTFAPVLGFDSAEVGATAAARWAVPNKGPAVLPIVISPCDFHPGAGAQLLQLHSITGSKKNGTPTGCTFKSSSGANLPGGFGFVDPVAGQCHTTVQVGQKAYSDPGNDLPSACVDVLKKHLGETVLLPLYKDLGAEGNKGWYQADGWVAFTLRGWRFPATSAANTPGTTTTGVTCESPCTGIIGEFVEFTTIDDAFAADPGLPSGADHGIRVVTLEE